MKYSSVISSYRSLKTIALAYFVLILILAIPRIIGPSWRSIMLPGDMRNLEGFPVHWESHIQLRSVRAMSANNSLDDLVKWYSTDEYRATIPIYMASVFRQVTGNYIVSVTIAEVVWWWIGAVAVFLFALQFYNVATAFAAGALTASSPLAIGHLGTASLHTASSMSLSLFLLIGWRILHGNTFNVRQQILLYGSCLFLSSVTYTYQWFLAPLFLLLCLYPKPGRASIATNIYGILLFLFLRVLSYAILDVGGIEVHRHTNDPINLLRDRVLSVLVSSKDSMHIFYTLPDLFIDSILGTISSYHPAILISAIFGAIRIHDKNLRYSFIIALILSVLLGVIYGVAWVLMTGYPFVYALAAHGMASGSREAAMRVPFLRNNLRTPVALLGACTLVAIAITNLDLIGDASFVIKWWQSWYVPH